MGAGGSIVSNESDARAWAAKESIPFDPLVMSRAEELDIVDFNHVKIKQMIPPKLPSWDHVSFYLCGERIACQLESGEAVTILGSSDINKKMVDNSNNMPNVCPETGCSSRVVELKGPSNSIHLSAPVSLSENGMYTVACWIKPEASLWKNAASEEKARHIKLFHNKQEGSACLALILNGNDFCLGICLNDQSFIIANDTKPLIADKWQLIVLTCETELKNKVSRMKKQKVQYKFYLATDDGYAPKNAGYIDIDVSIENPETCRVIQEIGSGIEHQDIGFLSSVYIWEGVKLNEINIESIFLAEYWRFSIRLRSLENELMERASALMHRLGMCYIGRKVTEYCSGNLNDEEKEHDFSISDENNGVVDEAVPLTKKMKPTLYSMIQNLSLWKREEKGNEMKTKEECLTNITQEKNVSLNINLMGDLSNMDMTDEELESILLILPAMPHVKVLNFSNNDKLTLNSLGSPLLHFFKEVRYIT